MIDLIVFHVDVSLRDIVIVLDYCDSDLALVDLSCLLLCVSVWGLALSQD